MNCPRCRSENPEGTRFCGHCGSPLSSVESAEAAAYPSRTKTIQTPIAVLRRGDLFAGRYEIIEELGSGGMGCVYRALDRRIEEEIAIKILNPDIAHDQKLIDRFRDELKFTRRIVHKNVCRIYDLNESGGLLYIVMEYVPGENLKSFIRRSGQLTPGKAISLAVQVAEGLAEAHRLDLVHRDLKPQNIMIDRQGSARIMDFGIARSLRTEGKTEAGMILGTPEYMSPEQAEGGDVDRRSDIYSLGLILYEMATGRVPFQAESPFGLALKHKTEIPRNPSEINDLVSEGFSRIILKCLEKDRNRRYQWVEDLVRDLRQLQASPGRDVSAPSIPTGEAAGPEALTDSARREKTEARKSIAVLPFDDLSPERNQEYFCDGLAEEIINALTQVRGLRVAARSSSFYFKGRSVDIREVGQKLNVGSVLEGSVRKAANRLRVTAQLIDVADGYHLWSEKYDRNLEDIFAVQDEISLAIVDKLKVRLLEGEKEKLVKRHTENQEAYRLYLQGRFFWNKRREKDLRTAIEYFEKVIQIDAGFALAYVGLADTYSVLQGYGLSQPDQVMPKSKAMALKALEIDSTLAEAHVPLAFVSFWYDWDWQKAESHFREAIKLNPEYGNAYHWFGWFLSCRGRFDEAGQHFQESLQKDPLSLVFNASAGWGLYSARQYDQAIEQFRRTLTLEPNYPRAHFWLGQALEKKGDLEGALAEFKKGAESAGQSPQYLAAVGRAYTLVGQRDEADNILKILNDLSMKVYVSPLDEALIYDALNERDKAMASLEKAFALREGWIVFLKVDPRFDGLRPDPRYHSLLRRISL